MRWCFGCDVAAAARLSWSWEEVGDCWGAGVFEGLDGRMHVVRWSDAVGVVVD